MEIAGKRLCLDKTMFQFFQIFLDSNKRASLLGARTLPGAPGLTTSNKKLRSEQRASLRTEQERYERRR